MNNMCLPDVSTRGPERVARACGDHCGTVRHTQTQLHDLYAERVAGWWHRRFHDLTCRWSHRRVARPRPMQLNGLTVFPPSPMRVLASDESVSMCGVRVLV